MKANTCRELELQDYIAEVDDQLAIRFRLDCQILFAKDYARVAYDTGRSPDEFVAWLTRINGLE